MPRRAHFRSDLFRFLQELAVNNERAWFQENKAPGDLQHLRVILAGLGKDPEPIIARAESQDIRDRYDAETAHARDLGIFGAPSFVWDGEIFWGDDRLEDAIDWAKTRTG